MASSVRDRRGFLRGVAAAAAAVGTGVLFSGNAHAVRPHAQAGKSTPGAPTPPTPMTPIPMPPVGEDIPCSVHAANAALTLNIRGALRIDFKVLIRLPVVCGMSSCSGCPRAAGSRFTFDLGRRATDGGMTARRCAARLMQAALPQHARARFSSVEEPDRPGVMRVGGCW
ncbi:twin-arginine translocation signal domain-containing protein [Streptomyces sp. NPDC054975]